MSVVLEHTYRAGKLRCEKKSPKVRTTYREKANMCVCVCVCVCVRARTTSPRKLCQALLQKGEEAAGPVCIKGMEVREECIMKLSWLGLAWLGSAFATSPGCGRWKEMKPTT